MKKIKLYGELGRLFGRVHFFEVATPAEAVRALCVNFPEFELHLINSEKRKVGYRVFNGRADLEEKELLQPATKEIKIIPTIMGSSGAAKIIVGAALIAVGVVLSFTPGAPASPFFYQAGAALILGGVAQLLTKTPKYNTNFEDNSSSNNKPSYLFNGAQNTSQQGLPVPLCYGQLIVGSSVISAGITVDQIMAGFRYVDQLTYVDVWALTYENNYLTAVPANYIRKELLDHVMDSVFYPETEQWVFRFWYNVRVLQAVPV